MKKKTLPLLLICAVSYISEKYGLDADVTGTRCEKIDPGSVLDFWPNPNGNVYVTMNDGKKVFTVYISGEEETTDGIDNYQYEEITDAFAPFVDAHDK